MRDLGSGGCQCGAVRYRSVGAPLRIGLCYCSECQRHSGSAFSMSVILPEQSFELTSGSLKRFVRKADSGRNVECAFCPECGTRIFHRPEFLPGMINLKPGTLDDPSGIAPTAEVFASRKPAWLSVAGIIESHPFHLA